MFEQKRFLPVICLLALLVPVLACGVSLTEADESPDVVGVIEGLRSTYSLGDVVLIGDITVPHMRDDARCEPLCRKVFFVIRNTPIRVQQDDGTLRIGSKRDLVAGAEIRGWTVGVELRSLPPYWFATRIEVTESQKIGLSDSGTWGHPPSDPAPARILSGPPR